MGPGTQPDDERGCVQMSSRAALEVLDEEVEHQCDEQALECVDLGNYRGAIEVVGRCQ